MSDESASRRDGPDTRSVMVLPPAPCWRGARPPRCSGQPPWPGAIIPRPAVAAWQTARPSPPTAAPGQQRQAAPGTSACTRLTAPRISCPCPRPARDVGGAVWQTRTAARRRAPAPTLRPTMMPATDPHHLSRSGCWVPRPAPAAACPRARCRTCRCWRRRGCRDATRSLACRTASCAAAATRAEGAARASAACRQLCAPCTSAWSAPGSALVPLARPAWRLVRLAPGPQRASLGSLRLLRPAARARRRRLRRRRVGLLQPQRVRPSAGKLPGGRVTPRPSRVCPGERCGGHEGPAGPCGRTRSQRAAPEGQSRARARRPVRARLFRFCRASMRPEACATVAAFRFQLFGVR